MNGLITASSPTSSQFYFEQSDAEILRPLVEYGFLQPGGFQRLTGRDIISLRRRLLRRVRRGYLERLTLPLERDAPVGSPPDAFVYQLAPRGILKAKEYGFADADYRYTREKSNLFLPHDLLITKIHLTIELATRGTALELVAWEQRRSVILDSAANGRGRLSVNPDALFGLKDREKPEGQTTTSFFLEIVHSRESEYEWQQSNLLCKMEAIVTYHHEGKHTARHEAENCRPTKVGFLTQAGR